MLATKLHASPKLKALVLAGLAAVTGAVTGYATTPPHGTTQWEQIGGAILVAWIASGASIIAGWTPTGAGAAIARTTSGFGLGREQLPPDR